MVEALDSFGDCVGGDCLQYGEGMAVEPVALRLEKVILEALPVALSIRLREEYPAVAQNMRVQKFYTHDLPNYVTYAFTSFLGHVHKQDKVETTLYKYPATVWEFFKDKYAPQWFLRRWPVRYESKKIATHIEKNFMCPHIAMPDMNPHVLWLMDSQDPLYTK